jgi:DNA gyrase subunit A
VKTISITDKTGALIAIKNVRDTDDLMIINKSGIILRMAVKDLRVVGRNTQGVKLIKLRGSDAIASVTQVPAEEEDDENVGENNLEENGHPIDETPEIETEDTENNEDSEE